MRMTKNSGVFLKETHHLHKAHQDDKALFPRRQPITTSVRQSRAHSGTCKIPGWARKRRKSYPLQTERTWRSPWCTIVQTTLEPPHLLVQMEAHFWQIKMLSWNGGPNISTVCSIAINYQWQCHQVKCNEMLDEFPTVTKTTKATQHLSSGQGWSESSHTHFVGFVTRRLIFWYVTLNKQF